MSNKRIVISGMSVNTPLGDTLDGFYHNLLAGRSAITPWRFFNTDGVYSKIGADLSTYDCAGKLAELQHTLPETLFKKLKKLYKTAPFSTRLSLLLTAVAWRDAGFLTSEPDLDRTGVIVAGHNINSHYHFQNQRQFDQEPDFIDGMFALSSLDTDQTASCPELIGARGAIYTIGGACASGNIALRAAIDEIRYHDQQQVLVLGAVFDMAPLDLHAMALLGAISYQQFNDAPETASRPFDVRREGFVPAHGGAVLVVESLESALKRNATIHAEVLGCECNADANHTPMPSEHGQSRLMQKLLQQCDVAATDVDYISAHATSTPLGDLTEIRSIKQVFGDHAYRLKINATKSLLGHVCWSAATVETVAAIEQMKHGKLHPSINIDELDPEIDLDICQNRVVEHKVNIFMKNAFGFGGINAISLFKRWEG